MPTLRNPKHEKFAQLVASGMTAQAAFTRAGYPSPQNAPRLRNNALVAKRIEELQARNERKAEMAALSRDELVGILAEIVHAARARLSEARLGDGLKAAEMLAKMAGWNEPEQVKHDHVHIQVDSALIDQLRAGFAALNARDSSRAQLIEVPSKEEPPGVVGRALAPRSVLTTTSANFLDLEWTEVAKSGVLAKQSYSG
jgi:hypothetical protein